MKPDTEKVLSILAAHENNAANLIAILQDVQAEDLKIFVMQQIF